MRPYEIRVMDEHGSTALLLAAVFPNDNAAVRAAQKIANRRRFEVWRGIGCIYGTHDAQVIPMSASNLSNWL